MAKNPRFAAQKPSAEFLKTKSVTEVGRQVVVWNAHGLAARVNKGTVDQPTPIGFYFARLWYFKDLYPIIFAAAGLNRCRMSAQNLRESFELTQHRPPTE